MGEPNVNYAQYFVGNSYLKMLDKTESGVAFANVTFEPRCRNNWHIHHSSKGGGQVLICVEGEGWYQEEGKEARNLKVGDIVVIPANVKHWHGAKKIHGLVILQLRYLEKILQMNGVKLYQMKNMINYNWNDIFFI